MIESLPTSPLVTGILTTGAVVAALAVIWTKAVRPFGKWVGDAVRNIQRTGYYLERLVAFFEGGLFERMVNFLDRERDAMFSRLSEVEQQNAEGAKFHQEFDERLRNIENGEVKK